MERNMNTAPYNHGKAANRNAQAWDVLLADLAINGADAKRINRTRAGSIRAAIVVLAVTIGLWGGMKLEQWATAHNYARVWSE